MSKRQIHLQMSSLNGVKSSPSSDDSYAKFMRKTYGSKFIETKKNIKIDKQAILLHSSNQRSRESKLGNKKYQTVQEGKWNAEEDISLRPEKSIEKMKAAFRIRCALHNQLDNDRPQSLLKAQDIARKEWYANWSSYSAKKKEGYIFFPKSDEELTIPQLITIVTKSIRTLHHSEKEIKHLSQHLKEMKQETNKYSENKIEIDSCISPLYNSDMKRPVSIKRRTKKYHMKSQGFENVFKVRSFKKRPPSDNNTSNTLFMFIDKKKEADEQDSRRKQIKSVETSKEISKSYNTSPLKLIGQTTRKLIKEQNDFYISNMCNESYRDIKPEEVVKSMQVLVSPPKIRNASRSQHLQLSRTKN